MIVKITLFLFLLIISSISFAVEYDAVILENNEDHTISFNKSDRDVFKYTDVTTIKRTIKINTLHGLNQFNSLYIPTYEDLNYSFTLIAIEARTIKADGSIIEVPVENIKTVTLPANYPFFFGYTGSVKQLVFENLSAGDVIEYSYSVIYTTNYNYNEIYHTGYEMISSYFPTKKYTISYTLNDKFYGEFYTNSDNYKFHRKDNKYTLVLTDIKPNKNEYLSIPQTENLYYMYAISRLMGVSEDNWSTYFSVELERTKKKEYFFGGHQIAELSKLIKKEASEKKPLEKIDILNKEFTKIYETNMLAYYETYRNYVFDLTDVAQVIKLLDLIEIEGGVVFTRKKRHGEIIEEFISLQQFDDFLVQINQDGKTYYWSPFTPFSQINDISSEYTGTKALLLKKNNGEIQSSFITLPGSSSSLNSQIRNIDFQFSIKNDNGIKATLKEDVLNTGQYSLELFPLFQIQHLDSSLELLETFVFEDTKMTYDGYDKLDFEMDQNSTTSTLNYSSSGEFDLGLFAGKGISYFYLADMLDKIIYLGFKSQRTSIAFFEFPFIKEQHISIKAPDGYNLLANDYLNQLIERPFAVFKSTSKLEDGVLKIDISFTLKNATITRNNWSEFYGLIVEMRSFYSQRILLSQ